MANLIVKDSFQDARPRLVAGCSEPFDHQRRDIEPARLEHHRHHREPGGGIVAGCMRSIPQAGSAP